MTFYEIALFVHIVGAIGAFVGLGLEWESRVRLSKAESVERVREFERLGGTLRILQSVSGAALLLGGLYMTLSVWGFEPWIMTGLGGLIVLVALGMATGQRTSRLLAGVAAEGGTPSVARHASHDPLLWASLQLRTGLALGVVFIMVVKPGLVGALVAVGLAGAVAVSLIVRDRLRGAPTDRGPIRQEPEESSGTSDRAVDVRRADARHEQ